VALWPPSCHWALGQAVPFIHNPVAEKNTLVPLFGFVCHLVVMAKALLSTYILVLADFTPPGSAF
jgi:hypothetical protein